MPFPCCAQKHLFPTASMRGYCSSNVQRIHFTGHFVMLEVGYDFKSRVVIMGRSGKGHLRDSMTIFLTPCLSLWSRALYALTLKSSFQLQTSQYFQPLGPGKEVPSSTSCFQKNKLHHISCHRITVSWDILFLLPIHLKCFGLLKHSLCPLVLPLAFCSQIFWCREAACFASLFSSLKLCRFEVEA